MNRMLVIVALFILNTCTTVSPFTLQVDGLHASEQSIAVQATLPARDFRINVTGRGVEHEGELSPEQFAVFTSSLKASIRENGLFRSVMQAGESGDTILEVVLLHHVIAGDSGGIIDVAYRIRTTSAPSTGRIIAFCRFMVTRSVKDCLHRATTYALLTKLHAANGGRPLSLESYEDAVFFRNLQDAVKRLPTKLVYVECLMWVTTNTGQECRMNKAHALDPVPWDTLIKENPFPWPEE